ncbi:unnamed protein product [Durusdinium trenchii]|uniref:DNA excision repair protein ERCC-8 n=1 Tax=Durusdinium trenchii TaxID=1381693 RepID=A0ABP0LNY2_9DINO
MGPWDAEEITLAQSGQPHETGVNRIAVEKQRKRLVLTGGRDGSVAISELSTLQVTSKALKDDPELASSGQTVGHKDSVEGLAWLPQDSRLFTSGAMDGFLKIWDAAEGVSVMSLDLHSSVRNLAINNQAKVAVALEDATLRLVDLRLGRPVNTMQGHTKPPLSVVWDHLEHLFSGGMDGTVRAWDIRMGARSLFLCDPYAHEGAWPLKRKMPEKPQRVQEEWQHEEAKPEPYRFRSMKRVLGTDRRFEEGSVRMLTTSDSPALCARPSCTFLVPGCVTDQAFCPRPSCFFRPAEETSHSFQPFAASVWKRYSFAARPWRGYFKRPQVWPPEAASAASASQFIKRPTFLAPSCWHR